MFWLEAEDVGIGGEKGRGGYCVIVARRLRPCGWGEVDEGGRGAGGGGGSSSASETPSALSLASVNSSTYLFQAVKIVSIPLLCEEGSW